MFSRSSIRHLKHKAKKSVLIRIGKTASSQEDSAFKELMANVNLVRSELKDMYNSSRLVVVTGKQYFNSLARFCGDRLRGEDLYNKEAVFLRLLEERVCPAIGTLLNKDLEKMRELIVEYKTTKLKFDTAYFKNQKDIEKKKGVPAEDNDEVKQLNEDLQALKDSYVTSKESVTKQRDAILSNLDTKLGATVEELSEASDTPQHQLYCQYIKEKISKTAKICIEGSSANQFTGRSKSKSMIAVSPLIEQNVGGKRHRSFSEDIRRVDDEKKSSVERTSPVLVVESDEDEIITYSQTGANIGQSLADDAGKEEEKDDGNTSTNPILSKSLEEEGEISGDAALPQKVESPRHEMSASPREESL